MQWFSLFSCRELMANPNFGITLSANSEINQRPYEWIDIMKSPHYAIIFITNTKWKVLSQQPWPSPSFLCVYCAMFQRARLLMGPLPPNSIFSVRLPLVFSILMKSRWHLNKGWMAFASQHGSTHLAVWWRAILCATDNDKCTTPAGLLCWMQWI